MRKIYEWFRAALTTAVAGIVIAVLGEFAIEVAREYGFYTRPTEKVGDFLNFIRGLPGFWPALSGLACLVIGMWLDSFVLRHVRSRQQLEEKPKSDLEIMFDETSDRFVQFSMEKMRQQRLVAIRNRGPKSVHWVSVRVRESGSAKVYNEKQVPGSTEADELILFSTGVLDPDATEFFEVMIGPADDSGMGTMAFHNRLQRFFLEARARDILTARAKFEYDPRALALKMISA